MTNTDPKVLQDYVATANSGKYSSWEEINAKFPELSDYDPKSLQDYVATSNSGKYKSWDEINGKFPELFKLEPLEKKSPGGSQGGSQGLQATPPLPSNKPTRATPLEGLGGQPSSIPQAITSPLEAAKTVPQEVPVEEYAPVGNIMGYEETQKALSALDKEIAGNKQQGRFIDPARQARLKTLTTQREKLKAKSDAAIADTEKDVNNSVNSGIGSNWKSFLTPEGTVNIEKIGDFARAAARKSGVPDDGYFFERVKNAAKGRVELEKITPVVDSFLKGGGKRKGTYEELYGTTPEADAEGMLSREDVKKGLGISKLDAEVNAQISQLNKDISRASTEEITKISTQRYGMPVEAYAEQLGALYQSQAAAIQQTYAPLINQEGLFTGTPEQYEAYTQETEGLNQAYRAQVAEVVSQNMTDVAATNNKANTRFTRQRDEILAAYKAQYVEKAKGINPILQERYKKAYKLALEKAMALDNVSKETKAMFQGYGSTPGASLVGSGLVAGASSMTSSLFRSLGMKEAGEWFEQVAENYDIGDTEIKSWGDILNPLKVAKSVSYTVGGMSPMLLASFGVGAATQGLGAGPLMTTLAAGTAGWGVESMSIVQEAYDQKFKETGSASSAESAANKALNGQLLIMPMYALEMAPFFGDMGKQLAKVGMDKMLPRIVAGGVVETAAEMGQEYPQGLFERAIADDKELSAAIDYASVAGFESTLMNVAPTTLVLGGAGAARKQQTKEEKIKDFAKTLSMQVSIGELTETVIEQKVLQMTVNAGQDFAKHFIATQLTQGKITEEQATRATAAIERGANTIAKAKEYKLDNKGSYVLATLDLKLEAAKAKAEAEQDPTMKAIAEETVKTIEGQAKQLVKTGTADVALIQFPNGDFDILTHEEARRAMANELFMKAFQAGDLKFEAMGKGQESLMADLDVRVKELPAASAETAPTTEKTEDYEPPLVFTTPTDERYAVMNRGDGKGDVVITKEEYEAEVASEKPVAEKVSESKTEVGSAGSEVKNKALEELVNLIPTTDLRRPNGSIGTQGYTEENLISVARFIASEMGFDIPTFDKNLGISEIEQVIEYLRGNKDAQQKIKEYVIKDPVVTSLLPDGTYAIEDGNHRANLLNLIGVDVIPTIELNGRDKGKAISEHDAKVKEIEQSQSNKQTPTTPTKREEATPASESELNKTAPTTEVTNALEILNASRSTPAPITVETVIAENVTEEETSAIAKEEGIAPEEVIPAIKAETVAQLNEKTPSKPKTLLQKVAARIKKALLMLIITAGIMSYSGASTAPSTAELTYDAMRFEGLEMFDKVLQDQEAINKQENIDIILSSMENSEEHFLIVDKSTGTAHLYQGSQLITSYQVGVGANEGDSQTVLSSIYLNSKGQEVSPNEAITVTPEGMALLKPGYKARTNWNAGNKTTGAGVFTVAKKGDYKGNQGWYLTNERGIPTPLALHKVTNATRARAIDDKDPSNNRVSNGCVNMLLADLNDLDSRPFSAGAKVFVLPDNAQNRFVLTDGSLRFESSDSTVNRTAAPYTAAPITLKAEKPTKVGKEVLTHLSEGKADLMRLYPTVSNDVYNQIARIAYGVFGQESSFGTFGGPRGQMGRIKDAILMDLSSQGIKEITVNGKPYKTTDPSVGITQLRFYSLSPEIREALGISSVRDIATDTRKATMGTMALLLDIYTNQIPDALKKDFQMLVPIGYNNRTEFKAIVNGQSPLETNEYVESVTEKGAGVEIYIGDPTMEAPSEAPSKKIPAGAAAGFLGLFGMGRRGRGKGDIVSDITDAWIDEVMKDIQAGTSRIRSTTQRLAEVRDSAEYKGLSNNEKKAVEAKIASIISALGAPPAAGGTTGGSTGGTVGGPSAATPAPPAPPTPPPGPPIPPGGGTGPRGAPINSAKFVKQGKTDERTAEEARKREPDPISAAYSKFVRGMFSSRLDLFRALRQAFGRDIGGLLKAWIDTIPGSHAAARQIAENAEKVIFEDLDRKVNATATIAGDPVTLNRRQWFSNFLVYRRIQEISRQDNDHFRDMVQAETDMATNLAAHKARQAGGPRTVGSDAYEKAAETFSYLKGKLEDRGVLFQLGGVWTLKQRVEVGGTTVDEANEYLATWEASNKALFDEMKAKAQIYFDYFRALNKFLLEGGILSQEAYDGLIKYDYIPMRHVDFLFSAMVSQDTTKDPRDMKRYIYELGKGSTSDISVEWDVLLSAATDLAMSAYFQNEAVARIAEAVKAAPNNGIIREATIKQGGQWVGVASDEGVMEYKVGGETFALIAPKGIMEQLYNKNVDILGNWGNAVRTYTFISVFKSITTNHNPAFGTAQLALDIPQALLASHAYSSITLGLPLLVKDLVVMRINTKEYRELRKDAAEHGALTSFTMEDRDALGIYLTTGLRSLDRTLKTNKWTKSIERWNEATEHRVRVAIYAKMLDKLSKEYWKNNPVTSVAAPGAPAPSIPAPILKDLKRKAAAEALNILNYSNGGTFIKPANQILAYLNPAIQAQYSIMAKATESPKDFMLSSMKFVEFTAASVGILLLSLAMLSDDDEEQAVVEYRGMQRYERDSYTHFRVRGKWFRMFRKPNAIKPFMNKVENSVMKELYGDHMIPDLDMWDQVLQMAPTTPQAAVSSSPLISASIKYFGNYDVYRGQSIVRDEGSTLNFREGLYDENVGTFYKYTAAKLAEAGYPDALSPKRADAAAKALVGNYNNNPSTAFPLFLANQALRFASGEWENMDDIANDAALRPEEKAIVQSIADATGFPKRFMVEIPIISEESYRIRDEQAQKREQLVGEALFTALQEYRVAVARGGTKQDGMQAYAKSLIPLAVNQDVASSWIMDKTASMRVIPYLADKPDWVVQVAASGEEFGHIAFIDNTRRLTFSQMDKLLGEFSGNGVTGEEANTYFATMHGAYNAAQRAVDKVTWLENNRSKFKLDDYQVERILYELNRDPKKGISTELLLKMN